jgi:hypothetical protein
MPMMDEAAATASMFSNLRKNNLLSLEGKKGKWLSKNVVIRLSLTKKTFKDKS